jgi:hypothetical protein
MMNFSKKGVLDAMLNCGDLLEISNNVEHLQYWLNYYSSKGKDVKTFFARGNHDDGINTFPSPDYKCTYDQLITQLQWFKSTSKNGKQKMSFNSVQHSPDGVYGYYDFEDKKIRIICLDILDYPIEEDGDGYQKWNAQTWWGLSDYQLRWFSNEALNLSAKQNKEEWAVICMCHLAGSSSFPNSSGRNLANAQTILKAFKNGTSVSVTEEISGATLSCDYSLQGSIDVIGWFAGHLHIDGYGVPTGLNYEVLTVTTPCYEKQRYTLSGWGSEITTNIPATRNINTIQETAFDIVVVNKKTKTVKLVRYGAGQDREYNY